MDMIAITFDIAMFLSRVDTAFRGSHGYYDTVLRNRHCDALEARTPRGILGRAPVAAVLQLHQVPPDDDTATEMLAGCVAPHRLSDRRVLARNEMREHQRAHLRLCRNAAGLLRRRVVREDTPPQIRRVRHARDEPVDSR